MMKVPNSVDDETSAKIASELRRSMVYLAKCNVPLVHILAIMHVEIIMVMVSTLGVKDVVECLNAAAQRVESAPTVGEDKSSFSALAGRVQ